MRRLAIVAAFLLSIPIGASAATTYHRTQIYALGGDGGWDYLSCDASCKRLFISRGTHVMVVDPQTGKVVGDIPDTPGVHGIAFAPDLGKGFTSDGADGTVTVFDLSSLSKIATVQTGAKNPDGIAYDPATRRLFTFNGGSDDATVIDARANAVVATIPLGGRPEFPVADGRGMVYDNIESTSEIVAIDARSAKVVSRFQLASIAAAETNAVTEHHKRLVANAFEARSNQGGSFFDILAPDAEWTIVGTSPAAKTYLTRPARPSVWAPCDASAGVASYQ
jgi:YVTN family beta-propeller protein